MKKVMSLILTIAVLMSMKVTILAEEFIDQKDIISIINQNNKDTLLDSKSTYKNIKNFSIDEIKAGIKSSNNVIVNNSVLQDKDIMEFVKKSIEDGNRVVITGDRINKNTVLNSLGYANKDNDYQKKDNNIIKAKETNNSLSRVGILVYKDGDIRCVGINTEKTDEEFVYDSFVDCINYEYKSKNRALNAWKTGDVNSDSDTYTRYNVHESLSTYKDPDSPCESNNYKSCAEYEVEVEPKGDYEISYVSLTLKEHLSSSKILSYQPHDDNNETQLWLSYPWGVTYPVTFGTKFDIDKYEGGINRNYSKTKFTPQSWAGYDAMTGNDMICNVNITIRKVDIDWCKFVGSYEIESSLLVTGGYHSNTEVKKSSDISVYHKF